MKTFKLFQLKTKDDEDFFFLKKKVLLKGFPRGRRISYNKFRAKSGNNNKAAVDEIRNAEVPAPLRVIPAGSEPRSTTWIFQPRLLWE